MKIIGKTKEGYLVEATRSELASITGENVNTDIGNIINVSTLFNDARETLNAYYCIKNNISSLKTISTKLINKMENKTYE